MSSTSAALTTTTAMVTAITPEATQSEADLVAGGLTSVLVINIFIFVIAIVFTIILRKKCMRFYSSRSFPEYQQDILERDGDWEGADQSAPVEVDGMIGWIAQTWKYDLGDMLQSHGLDSVVIVAYLRDVFSQFLIALAYGLVVLLPVHLSAGGGQKGLLALTLSNIPNGSQLLWFHVVAIYVYSFVTYYAMFNFHELYAKFRIRVMMRHTPTNYTVMVRELPTETKSGGAFDDHSLRDLFEALYPGEIVSAHVARHMPETAKLRAEREVAARSLEAALAQCGTDPAAAHFGGSGYPDEVHEAKKAKARENERPLAKKDAKCGCCGGEKVDAVKHWKSELERLDDEVAKMCAEEVFNRTTTGFVTFKTIERAYDVQQTLTERRTSSLMTRPAPAIDDVMWQQLHINNASYTLRTIVINVAFFFLAFFWSIPIAVVVSFANLTKLADFYQELTGKDGLRFLTRLPNGVSGTIQGMAPVVIVAVFLAIVPMILRLMVTLQGKRSESAVEVAVLNRYYLFIMINVFGTATLSGVLVDIVGFAQELANDPGLLPKLLGTAVPNAAFFFVNYVAAAAFGALALSLFRAPGLIVGLLKQKFLAKCARQFREAWKPAPYPIGPQMARHLLFFAICLTFSIATPLILPFAVMYYGAAHLFHKYNILHAHVPVYTGNGLLFESLFVYSYVGLGMFQLACIGIVGAKAGTVQAPFVLLLLPITYIMYSYTRGIFRLPSRFLSVCDAAVNLRELGKTGDEFAFAYRNAVLQDTPVTQAIQEAMKGTEAEWSEAALKKGEFVIKKDFAGLLTKSDLKQKSGAARADDYNDNDDDEDPDADVQRSSRKKSKSSSRRNSKE